MINWDELVRKMRRIDPNVTEAEIRKEWNRIMSLPGDTGTYCDSAGWTW